MTQEQDYKTLMSGMQELDCQGNAIPSELVLIGEHAFPLVMNTGGQVLMAASQYGQGRVVVLGHEGYLTRYSRFVENALMWVKPKTVNAGAIGIQKSLRSVADNLSSSPFKAELGDFQKDFSVYITNAYSVEACAKDLIAFVKAGGGLIIAGQAWHWASEHPQENTMRNFPGNKVSSVAGVYFSENPVKVGIFPVSKKIPSSWLNRSTCKDFKEDLEFLLAGVSEFDTQGRSLKSEIMVHGPLAFPIAVTPDREAFIAGAYYGLGRVILASHDGLLGRDSLSTFMINAIKWLDDGRKGVIGFQPNLKDGQAMLSTSGLDCQLTGFRKDLSVYVCTSYNDALCTEIQEFVAEGGGLLIGGHAWHWASTHCGSNVMTEYPGNRILNKMGLCLLKNTVAGGLYKAPEIDQIGLKGYHFHRMLQRLVEHIKLGQALTDQEPECLKKLGVDLASYLCMRCYDSAAYSSIVTLLSELVKEVGVPQVCSACPVKSAKDFFMLHIGSEVYKVAPDPDTLLPYIIKDRPNLPTVANTRVQISANTEDSEEWISTGLYLSPGMKTNISVPSQIVGKNWQVQIGCQTDNLRGADELMRAPVVYQRFPITSETIQVWNLWGGLIYLVAPPQIKASGVEIVVQRSVQAPYFKSGNTSVTDWVNKIRSAPGPWAELEFENLIITLESSYIRNLDCPDEVAKLWDSVMRCVTDLAAIPPKLPRKERFVAEVQISAGYMHSGYPIMMHLDYAPKLVDVEGAYKTGHWGPSHELGHNQQRRVWEFPPHTTECTCNLWSVYINETVLGLAKASAHPAMTLEKRQARIQTYFKTGRDIKNWTLWTALETYMQLQEKFGWAAIKKVFSAYHGVDGVPDDNPGKMNLYAETFSNVVKMNLTPFFKMWGWPIQPKTEQKLTHLPKWSDHPVSRYA